MKNKLIYIFLILSIFSFSQSKNGKIIYNYERIENSENNNISDFVMQDIFNFSMKGNKILHFNEKETSFKTQSSVSHSSFSVIDTDVLYINHDMKYYKETKDVFGKEFLEVDSLKTDKWIIDKNEIKEILGYKCFKAKCIINEDSYSKIEITIWFTYDIGVTAGPSFYNISNGVILMVELNKLRIIAKSIELGKFDIEVPEGKNIVTKKEFDKIYNEKLEEIKLMKN